MSKTEQMFRKKFKITGLEDSMYTTTIVSDFKPEKYMLPVKRGDVVDVIRITDCPPGKWLVKDNQENYGFVPVSCIDMNKDILTYSNQHLVLASATSDIYFDVEARHYDSGLGTDLSITSDSHSNKSDDTYDDIDNQSSPLNKMRGFGNFFKKDRNKKEELGPPTLSVNSNATSEEGGQYYSISASESNARENEDKSQSWRTFLHKGKEQKGKAGTLKNEGKGNTQMSLKKLAKDESIFREKFKFTGVINVLNIATISDSATLSPKDRMELRVKPGETVEVIEVTNEDQIICRNTEGKYGYVRIELLNFQ
ncbi:FYN-binding protein 2 [Pyxicephalus adspersus]|uniref:FYN-binding protein 2 n=1 Tax=Pyxicephalus adspersus TaxID=30357 RepID=UPI003B5BBDD6